MTFFFLLSQNFNSKFLGLEFFDKKFSFAPISFKIGSAYASEDSRKQKKSHNIFFFREFFSSKNFLKRTLIQSRPKSEKFFSCSKILNKNFILGGLDRPKRPGSWRVLPPPTRPPPETSPPGLGPNCISVQIDFCNPFYFGLPNTKLKQLQLIISDMTRLVAGLPRFSRERITPITIELHFLPIKARINFKICLLVYKALKLGQPAYLL